METEQSQEDDVHVMPNDGKHECSSGCWCEPEVYFVADNGNQAWLHKELQ